MAKKEEETGVEKLRKRFYRIRDSIKPPAEAYEILKKKEPPQTEEKPRKKIAAPRRRSPEAGV